MRTHDLRYAIAVGFAAVCLASVNSRCAAQAKDPRAGALDFDQIKALIADALREKDIDVEPPIALANFDSSDKTTEYVYPGRLSNTELFRQYLQRQALEAQLHVAMVRGMRFDAKERRKQIEAACDEAELEVKELLRLTKDPKNTDARAAELRRDAEKKMWAKLYRGFESAAELSRQPKVS